MVEGRETAADTGSEQQNEQPAANGPSLFEQAMGEKGPATLGGEPQKVADTRTVTIDGGAQERKPPEGQQQAQTEAFGEPKPPEGQQQVVEQPTNPPETAEQERGTEQATEQQRAGSDQVTVTPEFKKSISDLVDKIAGHMDSASVHLRQRDVPKAMLAFQEAAMLVGPDQVKQIADARKQVQELIKAEEQKAQSEQDATKLQELKQLERNLFVIEKAPGFTRANAALVLYQDGNIEQADKIMQAAVEADPSLKDDVNFNTRRREIEQKHSIKVLAQTFGEFDARMATQQQPGSDAQRGPPGETEQTGERPQERVEQQRLSVSPTDQSGKSPLEQVQAIALEAQQAKQLTEPMKQAIEKAIADADKGVTPKFQELQLKQGEFGRQVGQFLEAKTDRNEAVKDAVKRIDEQSKNLIRGLPLPPNAQVSEEQYRAHVAGLYQSLDTVSNEESYQNIVKALKEVVPNNTQFSGLLDERTKVTTQVRTALHPYNEMGERLVTEINQSANTRLLYAELLKADGKDPAKAQKYYTEAFATNQMADEMDAFREAANLAGVKDDVLLTAAIKQNQDRGGAASGKALEVEHLMGEALRQFQAAPEADRAKVVQALSPSLTTLQQMSDNEYGQSLGKMRAMSAEYDRNLPQDKKQQVLDLETKLADYETALTPKPKDPSKDSAQEDARIQQETRRAREFEANTTTFVNPESTAEARAAAGQALQNDHPEWFKAATDWQQMVGDKAGVLIGLKAQMGMESANTEATLKNKFFSREAHAEMLLHAGDTEAGKGKLLEAFGAVPKEVRGAFMNDQVKAVMQAAGVDQAAVDALPQPQGVQDRVATTPDGSGQTPPEVQQQQLERPDAPQQQNDAAAIQLNPKFETVSNQDLERLAMEKSRSKDTIPEAKEAFEELIKRYDMMLPPAEVESSKESIKVLQAALEAGKDVKAGPDGKLPVVDDATPLSEERRFQFHQAIMGDLETMNSQARIRLAYAQFLRPAGQLADAEKYGKEAVAMSDKLPIDLLKKQDQILNADLEKITDPAKRQAMQGASMFLTGQDAETGVIKMPINSRKFLAQFYLGTEVTPQVDKDGNIVGIKSIDFGKSESFKPDKAFEIAQETREKTKEILGFDPMDKEQAGKNPAVASLFAGLTEVFDNPDKYNLYKVTDAHQVEVIKSQIKSDQKMWSTLLNIGIIAGAGLVMVASKDARVIAAVESGLGRYGSAAPQIAYAAGVTTAVGGGLLARHYGYKALTGMDESWLDSGINVAGSLAAAEVGSRMLGKGSLFFSLGDKGPAFYAQQYKTAGELSKVVTNQEALRVLQALPEATALSSAEGMRAIRQAQILAAGEKLVGGTDALTRGLYQKFTEQEAAQFYNKNGYTSTGQFRDLLIENGYGAQAAKLAHLPPGTSITSAEAVAAIKEAGLYGTRTGTIAEAMIADLGKASGVNSQRLAEAMGDVRIAGLADDGVKTFGDLTKFIERDQRAVMQLNEITRAANASPNAKIADALGSHATTAEGAELLRTANRLGIKNVTQLRDMAQNASKLGVDAMFPKLGQLRAQNLISAETKLTEAAAMGKDVFAGNGLQRMLLEVPEAARVGVLSEKAVQELVAQTAGTSRLRAAANSFAKPFTSAGRSEMYTGAKEAILGAPSRLSSATHWVTDRVAIRALEPTTTSLQAAARARFAMSFKGALGITTTLNSTAGAWNTYQNGIDPETGGKYSVLGAIREANFPTMPGDAPAWSKMLGSTMSGSVGQAFAASFFLKPGAMTQPIWSEPGKGMLGKVWRSTPIHPRLWNNLNDGILGTRSLQAAGAIGATQMLPMLEASQGLERSARMKQMLEMTQQEIRNQPLPGQADIVEAPREQQPVEQPRAEVPKPEEQRPAQDTTRQQGAQPGDEPPPP